MTVRVCRCRLQELARNQLKLDVDRLDFEQIPAMYKSTAGLLDLVRQSENDSYLIMQLLLKLSALPLTRQITCLAGTSLAGMLLFWWRPWF